MAQTSPPSTSDWERHAQTFILAVIMGIGGYMTKKVAEYEDATQASATNITEINVKLAALERSVDSLNNRLETYSAVRQRLEAVEAKAVDHEQRLRVLERPK